MNFQEKVFTVTKKIPKGKVSTYKEVAKVLGMSRSYRAVGNALNKNVSKLVPCHRVIKSDSSVGGFRWGSREKIKKLKEEGIEIKNSRIDLDKYFYKF